MLSTSLYYSSVWLLGACSRAVGAAVAVEEAGLSTGAFAGVAGAIGRATGAAFVGLVALAGLVVFAGLVVLAGLATFAGLAAVAEGVCFTAGACAEDLAEEAGGLAAGLAAGVAGAAFAAWGAAVAGRAGTD